MNPFCKVQPVHCSRHINVRKKQVNIWIAPENLQCFSGIASFASAEAYLSKRFGSIHARDGLIFHNENF